jgi:hypothetical protein
LVDHEFGYAWLTRDGCEVAINALHLDQAKDKWERQRRSWDCGNG